MDRRLADARPLYLDRRRINRRWLQSQGTCTVARRTSQYVYELRYTVRQENTVRQHVLVLVYPPGLRGRRRCLSRINSDTNSKPRGPSWS